MQANSTVDYLVQAARDPALRRRIAIQTRAHTLTYEQLLEQVERVAGALVQRGVRRGEPVALLASDLHVGNESDTCPARGASVPHCPASASVSFSRARCARSRQGRKARYALPARRS